MNVIERGITYAYVPRAFIDVMISGWVRGLDVVTYNNVLKRNTTQISRTFTIQQFTFHNGFVAA